MISEACSLVMPEICLQLLLLLRPRCLGFFQHLAVVSLTIGDRLLAPRHVLLHLVEALFAAQEPVLQLDQLLPALLHLGLSLRAQLMHLILELHSSFTLS